MKKIMLISVVGLFVSGSVFASQLQDTSLLTEDACRKIKKANPTKDVAVNEQLLAIKDECFKKYPQIK